jgi:hypothetical protein
VGTVCLDDTEPDIRAAGNPILTSSAMNGRNMELGESQLPLWLSLLAESVWFSAWDTGPEFDPWEARYLRLANDLRPLGTTTPRTL